MIELKEYLKTKKHPIDLRLIYLGALQVEDGKIIYSAIEDYSFYLKSDLYLSENKEWEEMTSCNCNLNDLLYNYSDIWHDIYIDEQKLKENKYKLYIYFKEDFKRDNNIKFCEYVKDIKETTIETLKSLGFININEIWGNK